MLGALGALLKQQPQPYHSFPAFHYRYAARPPILIPLYAKLDDQVPLFSIFSSSLGITRKKRRRRLVKTFFTQRDNRLTARYHIACGTRVQKRPPPDSYAQNVTMGPCTQNIRHQKILHTFTDGHSNLQQHPGPFD